MPVPGTAMIRILLLAAAAAGLAACATGRGRSGVGGAPGAQPTRGPSTAAERARAVRLARELEQAPFAGRAFEERRWATTWLVEVPDITVRVCNNLFPMARDSHPFQAEIFAQMLLAQAAFIIQHPARAGDAAAVQLHGLESALRVYEKAFDRYPTANVAEMDHLISARDQGALADYVRRAVAQCN